MLTNPFSYDIFFYVIFYFIEVCKQKLWIQFIQLILN
jgi:hypothetical protein